jgi:RNA polymerase sigma-70 factor (ECF subfamily)
MENSTQIALVSAAQAGDRMAFDTLMKPYQRELLVHCYRMLGSVHDAEDLVQETLIRAWEKRATFIDHRSYRAWLYRIATNLCLNVLTRSPKRSLPPDEMLADQHTDPENHALQRERITLAFLVTLQHLTPTQRAILLLREVLDWSASEVAEWLNLSVPAVNSALQRARRTLQQLQLFHEAPPVLASTQLQTLLDRYVKLWEQADIPGLVALLREDAWFTMPPIPGWFQGRAAITTFFQNTVFTAPGKWRLYPIRANASPAFGLYRWEASVDAYQLYGLLVLDIVEEQIANTITFLELSSLAPFALPDIFPLS